MRTKEQHEAAYNGVRVSDVARELDCSRAHVIELIKAGHLKAVDIAVGSRPEYRIRRTSLESFLEKRAVA